MIMLVVILINQRVDYKLFCVQTVVKYTTADNDKYNRLTDKGCTVSSDRPDIKDRLKQAINSKTAACQYDVVNNHVEQLQAPLSACCKLTQKCVEDNRNRKQQLIYMSERRGVLSFPIVFHNYIPGESLLIRGIPSARQYDAVRIKRKICKHFKMQTFVKVYCG